MNRTATKRPKRAVDSNYLKLIKELPLRPIRSARDHAAAQTILDRLIGRDDLTKGQLDYLEGLVRFVEEYEREKHLGQFETLSPLDLLKHLMEENDMTTTDLGYVLGSRGLASEVLNGKRGLSKMLIHRLADRFQVDPALFLERPTTTT